jgi:hypothetical protein
MKGSTRKFTISALIAVLGIGGMVVGIRSAAAALAATANGQGAIVFDAGDGKTDRRNFSFSARQTSTDGTATGQANLVSRQYSYGNGQQPYMAHIDIKCMKVVGNTAYIGGLVQRTNESDPVYSGAVFFIAQDNGEPGKDADKITLAYFWDSDPNTVGDPMACVNLPDPTSLDDTALQTIDSGNIQVRQ